MVHQYKNNGYNIVLDVQSGAIHVVDDVTYDLIAIFENNTKADVVSKIHDKYSDIETSEIEEIYDEVQELVDAEVLFTPDIYEEQSPVYYVDYLEKDDSQLQKAISILK